MFTNIIKRDRNRVRLELSNRDPAVSALPRFSKYFSQLSFAAGGEKLLSVFKSRRKIWDDRSFGVCGWKFVWHVAGTWIFHPPDFVSHGDTDISYLGRDTWRRFEYLKTEGHAIPAHGMWHEYFIFECHNEWFAMVETLSKLREREKATWQRS